MWDTLVKVVKVKPNNVNTGSGAYLDILLAATSFFFSFSDSTLATGFFPPVQIGMGFP